MAMEHTVRAYDDELARLKNILTRMGGLAENQLASAIQAVVKRDSELAVETMAADAKVDELEREVDNLAVRLIALRQPVASDLRTIVAALRISGDIERIGDYAANVAKRAVSLNQVPAVPPVHAIPRMGALVQGMIKDVLDAFVAGDVEEALAVWKLDEEVDALYTSLFRELLTYMMEDPRSITSCTHLLFIAKNIERIGDHATNIAENVWFLVNGTPLQEPRKKGDLTSTPAIDPERAPHG